MSVMIDEKKLSELIENAVRKAMEKEFDAKFRELMLLLLPKISDEEQREIEELYGDEPGEDDVAKVLILERE